MRTRRTHRQRFLPWGLRLLGILLGAVILVGVWQFMPRAQPPPDAPDWVEQALLEVNAYSRPGTKLERVNGIVVHYIGNPGTTARQNRDYFEGLARAGETYASSNFIIGLEGETLQAVPSDEVAYASNSRNMDTLSIEVCHPDDTGEFTEASYAALVNLVQWLCDYYDLKREQVIRHYDVTGKECPRWFVQQPHQWELFLDAVTFNR